MEIYILREGKETGPFSEEETQRMLKHGEALINDLAWLPGMPQWLPLHAVLYPAGANPGPQAAPETPLRIPAEPATARQKAFLSYLGIPFEPEITKEQAALLVNDAMENPRDPARIARWNEDRLRLHPDLYAAEIQGRKDQRATRFFEVCQTEGAECLEGVTKAHCQVLVGYLDVKHPRWDSNETEAAWNYFFPAVREKFPQLVRKEWRDKLKFPQGPKVTPQQVRGPGSTSKKKRTSAFALLARGFAIVLILFGLAVGALYFRKHPEQWSALLGQGKTLLAMLPKPTVAGAQSASSASQSAPASTESGQPAIPPSAMDAPLATTPGDALSQASPADSPMNPGMSAPPPAPAPAPPASSGVALFDAPPAPTGAQAGALPTDPVTTLLPGPRTHVTLIQPVKIQTPYGPMEFRKGMTFPLISQEGVDLTVRFQGRIIDIPASATDLGGEAPAP